MAASATSVTPTRWFHHPTFVISLIIWFLGIAWGAFQIVFHGRELIGVPGQFGDLVFLVVFFMLLAGAAQQFMVFGCIHNLEKDPARWSGLYPHWYGTNFECALRLTVVLFLLVAGGEIPLQFKEYTEWRYGRAMIMPHYIFPLSSAILYSALVLWDVLGARNGGRDWKSVVGTLTTFKSDVKQQFLWNDSLGLVFWLALFALTWLLPSAQGFRGYVRTGALLFILLTAIVFIVVVGFRLKEWKQFVPWGSG